MCPWCQRADDDSANVLLFSRFNVYTMSTILVHANICKWQSTFEAGGKVITPADITSFFHLTVVLDEKSRAPEVTLIDHQVIGDESLVIRIHSLGIMNVCTKLYDNPFNSYWAIAVVDQSCGQTERQTSLLSHPNASNTAVWSMAHASEYGIVVSLLVL